MQTFLTMILSVLLAARMVEAHAAFWHPSMWGFNVSANTFSYDNRPVVPLKYMNFSTWWFHGHLDYPPNDGDFFELPAGKSATAEIACTKGATSFEATVDSGGDVRHADNVNDVCPGKPMIEYHTTGIDNVKGCALSIAYKSDVSNVTQDDFTVFSVNQTCVWTRFTEFEVPERMPACPEGGCICAWHWIHSIEGGGEENYMNGFRCNVTGATSDVPLAEPVAPRRCGADVDNNKASSVLGNCTYGAKTPIWWLNNQSDFFEAVTAPPFYNDLYNFVDGAQDDIFADSYVERPDPAPTAQLPVLRYAVNALSGILSVASDVGDQASSFLSSVFAPPATTAQTASATAAVLTTPAAETASLHTSAAATQAAAGTAAAPASSHTIVAASSSHAAAQSSSQAATASSSHAAASQPASSAAAQSPSAASVQTPVTSSAAAVSTTTAAGARVQAVSSSAPAMPEMSPPAAPANGTTADVHQAAAVDAPASSASASSQCRRRMRRRRARSDALLHGQTTTV
ncbi:hypothetical protein BD626DRAFT_626261 [Schizophyllum amplum]|uniref:Lytic polysaccharide monooxygenase n=1 Tax=Schizophyllum amplum TaxID=97359 RepID=A0A550CSW1_9AGAR|nr:hypothetical protein BD626DRAFT_626261 [Auriculariopsis ampla]